jgi:hypothetical protein
MKHFDLRNHSKLELTMPDGSNYVLIRRNIPAKDATEYDKTIESIRKKFFEDKNLAEFCHGTLEKMCENYDRSKFDDVDIFALKDIIAAFGEMDKEFNRASEKKTG